MDNATYKDLLEKTRKWYKTIGKVYCPCLKEDVVFNSKGFRHLRYDGKGKERATQEQIIRLKLLPLVIPLIQQSKNIYEQRNSKLNSKIFYTLQGVINERKIRVVLIKESSTKTIYFSVMKTR